MKMLKKSNENLKKWISKNKWKLVILGYAIFAPVNIVYGADAKWNAFINFLLPWILRLGGALVLIGGVEFGLAFKQDDPEGKTKGIKTVIAGCIVAAISASSSLFLF